MSNVNVHILFKVAIVAVFFPFIAASQKMTVDELKNQLDSVATVQKGLNNEVQLNVSNIQMADLLNTIGLENNLNLSVDPKLIQPVAYNFYDVPVKDVFVFLYSNYDVKIDFIGSIIAFKKRLKTKPKPTPYQRKIPEVKYNEENAFLSVDLENDTLQHVTNEITRLSGKNFIVENDIKYNPVSGYFVNRPIEEVAKMIAAANDLKLILENGSYYLKKDNTAEPAGRPNTNRNSRNTGRQRNQNSEGLELENLNNGTFSISARDVSIKEVITTVAEEMNEHYFMYEMPEDKITLSAYQITFEELLMKCLMSTEYTYKLKDRVFVIGQQSSESLRATELIKLEYRTVEDIIEMIPKELVEGLEIYEFIELNGLVVSGSTRRTEELRAFLHSIDQVVPMVQIDIIILYSQKGSDLATGIKAALDASSQETGGEIYPEVDMNYNSTSLNAIIDALNGFGNLNLGKVTSDFFLSLQALESNNVVETESTPKISTLNGHEATLSIGEQRYYQEERVQVSNTVGNANIQNSRIWKQIEASLEVDVKPFVSSDEHVTLEIDVGQNDFGEQVDPTAPPNKTTQNFKSFVRVKNGEVILMGGLEKKSSRDSGSGVPILSRIPILKWFLSSRSKSKEKSKLHILIRPTVTY